MSPMTLSRKSEIRRVSFISSRVTQVLKTIDETDSPLGQQEKRILKKGLCILDDFIAGSRLIEGDYDLGLVPSEQSLGTLNRAVTTLDSLQKLGKKKEVSECFIRLRSNLSAIYENKKTKGKDLKILSGFFSSLSQALYTNVTELRLGRNLISGRKGRDRESHGFRSD